MTEQEQVKDFKRRLNDAHCAKLRLYEMVLRLKDTVRRISNNTEYKMLELAILEKDFPADELARLLEEGHR